MAIIKKLVKLISGIYVKTRNTQNDIESMFVCMFAWFTSCPYLKFKKNCDLNHLGWNFSEAAIVGVLYKKVGLQNFTFSPLLLKI